MIKLKYVLRILLTAVLFVVISQIFHSVGAYIALEYYFLEEYMPVWSKIMMPEPGPPPLMFTLLSAGASFLSGIIFSTVYYIVMDSMMGKSWVVRGLEFGLIMFFMTILPGLLSMVLLINLPIMLLVFWMVEGLLISLLSGIMMVKIIK